MKLQKYILSLLVLVMAAVLPAHSQTATFPYPQIPDVYRDVEQRAKYLAEHYWDNFQFRDTTVLNNADITEQGFSNFLDLLPRFSPETQQLGIKAFTAKAFQTLQSKERFQKLIDHYLGNPESPFQNDAFYQKLLTAMKERPEFDETEKEQLAYKAKIAGLNLPGTTATDFTFVDRQGKTHRLSDYKAGPVLLYFNDPDCEVCHATTQKMKQSTIPQDITVIAIYGDTETEEWKKNPQPFPTRWIDGYSPKGEIVTRQLYDLHAMPALYLLDVDNLVVLKDRPWEQIQQAINQAGQTTEKQK